MGLLDRFRAFARAGANARKTANTEPIDKVRRQEVIGATKDNVQDVYQSYTNSNITFAGNLTGYDYDSILRDKQGNIISLYQLSYKKVI